MAEKKKDVEKKEEIKIGDFHDSKDSTNTKLEDTHGEK